MSDNKGRILILNVTVDVEKFVLINLYNPNTEKEQVEALNTLLNMMKTIDINGNSKLSLAGDFNVCFNINLERCGGSPSFKQKSVTNMIEIIETFNSCEIWRIRNPKKKRFTVQASYKDAWITFSFLTPCKTLTKYRNITGFFK